MIRIHVICEGQTEEQFINEVLGPKLFRRQIALVPSLIGKPGHKGGNVKFDRLFTDIRNRLMGDRSAWCTTFFDFYGLPSSFPGKQNVAVAMSVAQKSQCVCDALNLEVGKRLGVDSLQHFLPYVQMYEFESLLFSKPDAFASVFNRPELTSVLCGIRTQFSSPEEINDSVMTAPSKRIVELVKDYEKPLHGSLVALETGLSAIRAECQLFHAWVSRLELLSGFDDSGDQ